MAHSSGIAQRIQQEPDLLGIYLNDHLAAGTAGVDLFDRAASALRGTPPGEELDELRSEIEEDRATLLEMMTALGVPVRQYKVYAARAAERLGRLKPNGHLRSRSPLSTLVELETMLSGIHGKAALWRTLRSIADHDSRLDAVSLSALLDRAARQVDRIEELRTGVVRDVFGPQ